MVRYQKMGYFVWLAVRLSWTVVLAQKMIKHGGLHALIVVISLYITIALIVKID
jgi:hypothetical protein